MTLELVQEILVCVLYFLPVEVLFTQPVLSMTGQWSTSRSIASGYRIFVLVMEPFNFWQITSD